MKLLIFILIISFLSPALQAKKLYKYRDSKGLWHFSDKPPVAETDKIIEVRQLKAAKKRYVWLEKRGDKQKPEYFVINNYQAPIEIKFSLSKLNNAISKPTLPKRFIVAPGRSKTLFKVTAFNKFKSWGYSLKYVYIIGSPLARHDESAVYLPPFEKGTSFSITQAFGGGFSHTDKQNKYAVDLAMPINTPVYAARTGVVIEVNNDFFNRGTTQFYKTRANSIRILHEDGSMAVYAHLAVDTAQVYPGLKVYAGQLIGYSGNTGFSSGPHLHFAVQLNKGMELVSVPFKFTQADGSTTTPVAGSMLSN